MINKYSCSISVPSVITMVMTKNMKKQKPRPKTKSEAYLSRTNKWLTGWSAAARGSPFSA